MSGLELLGDVSLVLAFIIAVPVALYLAARLITHAVLKTRQEFHTNGGDEK